MIPNNSTNTNKTNNHLLPETVEHEKLRPGHIEQAQKCDGVEPFNEIPTLQCVVLLFCFMVSI